MSFDVNNLTVMQKPVKDGRSNNGVSEEFLPVGKAFV
jgi:hypothetical protein